MHKRNTTSTGFTIVELLIVVVVIAILAAISVVAYTGIQNRAYDSVVQNDLSNFAKKIELAAVETGEYPAGGLTMLSAESSSGSNSTLSGFTFALTKSAYFAESSNVHYCTGTESSTGQPLFRIRAISKSGNTFLYSSRGSVQNLGVSELVLNAEMRDETCQGLEYPFTWSLGFRATDWTWASWVY